MPNILLNKREELLPLLLLAIQHHPDAQTRDQLLNILFNLMKKPDADQRKVILKGFKKIAKYLGHDKVEAELLPQLWEQIDHKVTRFKTIIKWVLSSRVLGNQVEHLALGPFKYYVSKEVGGVRKWQFILIYSIIYVDLGGWVGLKTPKTC